MQGPTNQPVPTTVVNGATIDLKNTSDTPVTVLDTVPEPVFTLLPSTYQWDGRSLMTVQPTIANWAALLASGYTNLAYNWTVAGVAVTKTITPGLLTLTRSQGSGQMTVTVEPAPVSPWSRCRTADPRRCSSRCCTPSACLR